MVEGVGFVIAGRLALGNAIVTRAGPALTVAKIEWRQGKQPVAVYNFEVEEDHTYFVGSANGGLWVHNIECTKVALNMQKALGGEGEIQRVEGWLGRDSSNISPKDGYEAFGGNFHHDVLFHDGKVFDPMMEKIKGGNPWVDQAVWMKRWDMRDHVIRPWSKGMESYRGGRP